MPKLREESTGGGDLTWLGSLHGTGEARTVTVLRSSLTAGTHYPEGVLRAGQPLAIVAGKAVPYNAAGTDGSQILAGFLLRAEKVVGDKNFAVPLLDHGRIRLARVQALTGVTVAANVANTGQFVFI